MQQLHHGNLLKIHIKLPLDSGLFIVYFIGKRDTG